MPDQNPIIEDFGNSIEFLIHEEPDTVRTHARNWVKLLDKALDASGPLTAAASFGFDEATSIDELIEARDYLHSVA